MSWTDRIPRTLRRVDVRVATTLALTLAPLIGALVFLFYAYATSEVLEEIDERARHRLDEVGQALSEPSGQDAVAALAPLRNALAREGIGLELRGPDGRMQVRSGAPADPRLRRRYDGGFLTGVLVPGETFLRYAHDLPSGARVEATVALRHFAEERAELAGAAWICLAGGLVAAALIALLATRRAMAPLRDATSALDRIDASQLEARLLLRGTGDDVDRHASAVNRVLERLEAAFARMSAFSSDVAHELRTPVNRILNLAEVALLSGQDAKAARALGPIRDTADEMGRLVEGLLTLARDEQGKLSLSLERLPVADLLAGLQRLYAPACEERGIRLTTAASGGVVEADRTLLSRALANLLDNAIRFTPDRGSIRVEAAPAPGGLSIRVCDSGRGIPAADRELVFERFARLDPTRSGPGTGLGLPIARMIARVHGGELRVADSPLGGACLSMRLPVRDAAPVACSDSRPGFAPLLQAAERSEEGVR